MRWLICALAAALVAGAAVAEPEAPSTDAPTAAAAAFPQECFGFEIDYRACEAAAPEGSPGWWVAQIALGVVAELEGDEAQATRRYGAASRVEGNWPAVFHSMRALLWAKADRQDRALEDAKASARLLLAPGDQTPAPDQAVAYGAILLIMKDAKPPEYAAVLVAYRAMPPGDWKFHSGRSMVMEFLGEREAAIEDSAAVVSQRPDGLFWDRHCGLLFDAGRAAEALPYCERAAATETGYATDAYDHMRLAEVLASLGQCEKSARAMKAAREIDSLSEAFEKPPACTPA